MPNNRAYGWHAGLVKKGKVVKTCGNKHVPVSLNLNVAAAVGIATVSLMTSCNMVATSPKGQLLNATPRATNYHWHQPKQECAVKNCQ